MFHISLLKQWRESLMQQVLGDVELEDAERPEYFEVKKILRCGWSSKTRRQRREFLVLWQDIQRRMQSGFPHHISVIKMRSKKIFRPTGFLRNNRLSIVSEDRNSSWGGVVVGNLVVFTWGCHSF